MLPLLIILVLAVPIVAGLVISQKQRGVDRRHFATFVGYVSSVVAIINFVVWLIVGSPPYLTEARQVFLFVFGIIWLIAWLVLLLAGLFSRGVQRLLLLLYGMVIAFSCLLVEAANFGR